MNENMCEMSRGRCEIWLRSLLFLLLIYLFLSAVKMFEASTGMFRGVYNEEVNALFSSMNNPFVGLCIGIFATALMNSSSATTSIVVALVASGVLDPSNAVSIVIGANIGASITSMMVSMGNITDKKAFIRGYGVPFIQDWYSILTAIICFTLEFSCGFLSNGAAWLADKLAGGFAPGSEAASASASSGWLTNPLPVLVGAPVNLLKSFLEFLCLPVTVAAILIGVCALSLLFFALIHMTKNMKILMADRVEEWINKVLSKNGCLGLLIGWIVTMIIQSSGITTSLIVPLVAAGVLKIRTAYPLILGAKLGTPITGVLAALAFLGTPVGSKALAIALVHFLFNVVGVGLFYPIPFLRLPVFLTERFAPILGTHRAYVISWVVVVFFVIPVLGIFLFQ